MDCLMNSDFKENINFYINNNSITANIDIDIDYHNNTGKSYKCNYNVTVKIIDILKSDLISDINSYIKEHYIDKHPSDASVKFTISVIGEEIYSSEKDELVKYITTSFKAKK